MSLPTLEMATSSAFPAAAILSVVDAYTRECLALEADTSLGNGRVTRVLEQVIAERGMPENVRSGQRAGVHFALHDRGPKTGRSSWYISSRAARCQNGHAESFHGRLRDECLNATWFQTLNEVSVYSSNLA